MLTMEIINKLAAEAELTVIDVNLHPYGRKWQAIVYFTEEPKFGVSLLYNPPFTHVVPTLPYSLALIESYDSANEGFILIHPNDLAQYDMAEEDAIDWLKLVDWALFPPDFLF